jgi:endonuclease V-like protein UPF0215 family
MLTPEEIDILIYEMYPVVDRERTCVNFAFERQHKREKYRKELIAIHGIEQDIVKQSVINVDAARNIINKNDTPAA